MDTRLQRVATLLRKEKADALLVWNSEGGGQPATEWLTGFSGSASVMLIVRGSTPPQSSPLKRGGGKTTTPSPSLESPPADWQAGRGGTSCFLITDGRYTAQAKKETKGFTVFISSAKKPTLKILGEIIKKNKLRTILFDGSVTTHSVVEEVREYVKKGSTPLNPPSKEGGREASALELISRKHILQEVRMVKEKEEIQLLTRSAEIACKAFTKLLPEIHAGITENDIAKRLEDLMLEEGAEGIAFPTIVASGKNGALPHARPSDKKIKNGELVTIDFGARYKGYVSDMTRTLAIGKVSPRLKKVYEVVRKAQELGCKKAKAGVTGAEIDVVCRNYLTKKGFGKYFTHSTGHGIGMEVHELPSVSPRKNTPLNPPSKEGGRRKEKKGGGEERGDNLPAGAVVTCEPGVYIPNVGGVRIEDALVLTKNGNINLTEGITKELIVV